MATIRLTAAQALVKYLSAQLGADGEPLCAGIWAIFGHGNVAGLGEAMAASELPMLRGHNEQGMALAACGFAKATRRARFQAVTTSIGPGATNLVTAAAVAHINRLPLLLLPGDVFASRRPDPVLQQIEDFSDATVSANDTLRPVSRYFDRIARPEQLLAALPRAFAVLTDPAECGPVTLAFCQDTQTEAYDWPQSFFTPKTWRVRRPATDAAELEEAVVLLETAKSPLIVAGGGVHYAGAGAALAEFARRHNIPVAETQAGKGALTAAHPLNLGAIGVTGSAPANAAAAEADVVLAVGTRLGDFTTGSWAVFRHPGRRLIGLNVQAFDAAKRFASPLVADAAVGLAALSAGLGGHRAADSAALGLMDDWRATVAAVTAPGNGVPTDAQVIGAVQRSLGAQTMVVGAAGGLPGELHKLWQVQAPGTYHLEYGYSCMGYEIAGALGAKLADPAREIVVLLGDGSWLMMHAELATSVAMGMKLIVVLLDNGGFGCIDRLQRGTGGQRFGTMLQHPGQMDFAQQAAGLGAVAMTVDGIAELESALASAHSFDRSVVIVLRTDAGASTEAGGHWWDVAVPEVSGRAEVNAARTAYVAARQNQILGE